MTLSTEHENNKISNSFHGTNTSQVSIILWNDSKRNARKIPLASSMAHSVFRYETTNVASQRQHAQYKNRTYQEVQIQLVRRQNQ